MMTERGLVQRLFASPSPGLASKKRARGDEQEGGAVERAEADGRGEGEQAIALQSVEASAKRVRLEVSKKS